jgi:hypothetical protein
MWLYNAWYWVGRIPAILFDLSIDWPPYRPTRTPTSPPAKPQTSETMAEANLLSLLENRHGG